MNDPEKLIADVLDAHTPTWKRQNHPTRKGILVNLLACTGCEWIADSDRHQDHVAAEIVKALGGLQREERTNPMSSAGVSTNYNTGEVTWHSDMRRDQRWVSEWKPVQP